MKDASHLFQALSNLQAKAASAPDPKSGTDPDEKGKATSKGAPESTDEINPVFGKGEKKLQEGEDNLEVDGIVNESNGGDSKSAAYVSGKDLKAQAQSLRQKLAAATGRKVAEVKGGLVPSATGNTPGPAPTPIKGDPDGPKGPCKEDKMASQQVPSALTELTGLLLKSAQFRQHINEYVDESVGEEVVRGLLEKAASEQEQQEIAELQARAEAIELHKLAEAQTQAHAQLVDTFSELTKEASQEDFEKIEKTSSYVQKRAAAYEHDDSLSAAFGAGVHIAKEAMAAMEAGSPAPMDAAMPMPEESDEVTMEDIVMALEALVQQGDVAPEEAEAVLRMLLEADPAMAEGGQKSASAAYEELNKRASVQDDILGRLGFS